MRLKVIFLIGLLAIPLFAFAQELTTSVSAPLQLGPQEQMRDIINNFESLYFEKRKAIFNSSLNQIQSFQSEPNKDLYVARLLVLFSGGENKENYTKAYNLTEQYLKNNPDSYEGYYVLALVLNSNISFEDSFFKAPSEWKNKESIELRKKALVNIEKSLLINNAYSEAYKLKGELSEGDEKLDLFEKAIEMNPANDDAWRDLVIELSDKKRNDEAIKKLISWNSSTKSKEVLIEIINRTGEVYRENKDYDNAILNLKNALQMRNDSGQDGVGYIYSGIDVIYLSLAKTYLEMKNYTSAEVFYKAYLEINPKEYWVRFDLAKMYHDIGEKTKAIAQYEQVLAYSKEHTSSIYNLGLLYEESDKEKSKQLFTKYIQLQVNNDDKDSKTWVENAKSQLSSLGVYEYPKSKKEMFNEKIIWIRNIFCFVILIFVFIFLIRIVLRYKTFTRWVIILMMVTSVVLICLIEAGNASPNIARVILYFVPILSIGGLLLYVFRSK